MDEIAAGGPWSDLRLATGTWGSFWGVVGYGAG